MFFCAAVPEENLLAPEQPDLVSGMVNYETQYLILSSLIQSDCQYPCAEKVRSSLYFFSILRDGCSWRFHSYQAAARKVQQAPA